MKEGEDEHGFFNSCGRARRVGMKDGRMNMVVSIRVPARRAGIETFLYTLFKNLFKNLSKTIKKIIKRKFIYINSLLIYVEV
tara:strand:- start:5065 stop:5310 length:246 start_codon:yes stop_codon:yes gene_type:complete